MTNFFKLALRELRLTTEEPFVLRSQLKALKTQLPLLYAMLITNALALISTHLRVAPVAMTLIGPGLLIPICLVRIRFWQKLDIDRLDDVEVRARLHQMMVLVAVLGGTFTAWSELLLAYGDVYQQAHVLFFMAITVVGCIFCLVYLRAAALLLAAIVVPAFVINSSRTGDPVLIAVAVNLIIVTSIMVAMMLAYSRNFRSLVHNTEALCRLGEAHKQAAQHDALTGLANRSRFFEDCRATLRAAQSGGEPFTLGLLDLDGFKPVNDLYGHLAGDRVLQEVGRRLQAALREPIRVARLGGDEFGMIIPCGAAPGGVVALGRGLCGLMAEPIQLENRTIRIGATIGFAVHGQPQDSLQQLVERADFALYHAKDRERGTALLFSQDHAREIGERRRLEHALRVAHFEVEMTLAYQPVIDIRNGRVVAFEALARWTSPLLGPVSPGAFIPMAERLGLIGRLTDVLFTMACADARLWPAAVGLSFNLSAEELTGSGAADRLEAMVTASGLSPGRLTFEVTETAVMRNFEQARTTLERLRACGCQVALDDFGTGFSSLSYVNRLPLDKLKIDQSFVRSLDAERTSRTIIETIVDMSENLGLDCIVEGVETDEQVVILRSIGCLTMQGYRFGRPMPAAAVAAFLIQDPRPSAACAA